MAVPCIGPQPYLIKFALKDPIFCCGKKPDSLLSLVIR